MDEIKKEVNGIIDNNIPFVPPQKKPLLSPLTQIDMQLGFLIGTICGIIGADVCILIFIDMNWIFKMFTVIGALGVLGSLSLGLFQTIMQRRQLISQMNGLKDLEEMFKASQSRVADPSYIQ